MSSIKILINKPFYRFIILALLCYVVWFFTYEFWLKPNGKLDNTLSFLTTYVVVKLMQLIGYAASYRASEQHLYFFYNNGYKILQMVPACNGQVLYPLYAGFIIATPGYIKDKIKIIGIGCIIIFIINAVRVLALCLVKIHMPQYLAFNHKYTFTVIVYGCIFLLWIIWIKYFASKTIINSSKNDQSFT